METDDGEKRCTWRECHVQVAVWDKIVAVRCGRTGTSSYNCEKVDHRSKQVWKRAEASAAALDENSAVTKALGQRTCGRKIKNRGNVAVWEMFVAVRCGGTSTSTSGVKFVTQLNFYFGVTHIPMDRVVFRMITLAGKLRLPFGRRSFEGCVSSNSVPSSTVKCSVVFSMDTAIADVSL